MGIRFNRLSSRATNGPMIFFSDPSAEINLHDEIRGAINSCLSFYAYRKPGDTLVTFGSSEGVVKGLGTPGFVIAPFEPGRDILTIPYRPVPDMVRSSAADAGLSALASTSSEEHRNAIERIKSVLSGKEDGKIVSARVRIYDKTVDTASSFSALCRMYPDAFVYMFSTPLTGCWIGATPELLLESRQQTVSTIALAGTRKRGGVADWDVKNIREQEMVSDYITDCMSRHGFTVERGSAFTKTAGPVEHICTPIKGFAKEGMTDSDFQSFIKELHPTPAVCGLPKDTSLDIIKETESFDRMYYGGFCGPFHSFADFSFYVTLRCAMTGENRLALFAGGGITALSDPDAEWEETELKLDTLRNTLLFDDI